MPTLDEQTALDFPGEVTIHYDDDSGLGRAGRGLQSFPLMNVALRVCKLEYWLMSPAEQVALVFLLEHLARRSRSRSAHDSAAVCRRYSDLK
jgi:hypothetical protein